MLICTARSEKHLHVSADRMCRWLRREHALRADAAGLLGRNELKIKLRRKAKRMKMMANVGAAADAEGSNIDDGIRTGWICCTVGKIEAHPLDVEVPGDNVDGFVGFRDVKPGVNVVIQMFTEEKRDEIDLETLWGGVVKTGRRKDKVAEEKLREFEELDDENVVENQDVDGVEQKLSDESSSQSTPSSKPTPTNLASSPISTPTQTPPQPHFAKPRPTPSGDAFPDLDSFSSSRRQKRRIHTVGLLHS